MDSTLRSNLTVGMPIDLLVYRQRWLLRDAAAAHHRGRTLFPRRPRGLVEQRCATPTAHAGAGLGARLTACVWRRRRPANARQREPGGCQAMTTPHLIAPAWRAGHRRDRAGAAGAAWPTRPIRIIVPFGLGGSADVAARFLAEPLSAALGQPVVIENRPGAGGTIGTDAVAKRRAGRLHAAADVEHPHGERDAAAEPALCADARPGAGRARSTSRTTCWRCIPRSGARRCRSSSPRRRRSPARSTMPPPARARPITSPARCSPPWPGSRSTTSPSAARTRRAPR